MNKEEVVMIKDKRQAIAYIKFGVKPIDVQVNSKDILIFVFKKSETKDLYIKWRKHELIV